MPTTTLLFHYAHTAISIVVKPSTDLIFLGLCYTDSPEEYFRAGLDMYTMLEEQRKQIKSMNGTTISVKGIEALFPKKVNVVCDPQASTNTNVYQTFSELQICFIDERTMIDCPTAAYESVSRKRA